MCTALVADTPARAKTALNMAVRLTGAHVCAAHRAFKKSPDAHPLNVRIAIGQREQAIVLAQLI